MTKLRVPRQHGAHRTKHKGLLAFVDLYKDLTGKVFVPAQQSRHRSTVDDDTVEIPRFGQFIDPLPVRIDQIEQLGGVHVTVDPHFTPQDCGWCLIVGRLTTVRVYGDPAGDDLHNPLIVAESCHPCALSHNGPIRQARIEQNHDSRTPDIRVEVSE